MKAIILAGGQSSRFKPMPDKTTIEFIGKPLIVHRLEALKAAGFLDVDIVASPNNIQQIERAIKEFNHHTSRVFLQDNPNNNGGAVVSVPDDLLQEPALFVCANDTVENYLLHQFYQRIQTEKPQGLFLGQERQSYFDGGYLEVNKNGTLKGIIEKPGEGRQPSNLINIVYQYYEKPIEFKQKIQSLIKLNNFTKTSYEDAIQSMINDGLQIKVHSYSGQWSPIKYPNQAISTGSLLVSINSCIVSNQSGPIIHKDAKIHPTAKITGLTYIGKDVILEENVVVHSSHVLESSHVSKGTHVMDSYVSKNNFVDPSIYLINIVSDEYTQFLHRNLYINEVLSKGSLV